MTKVGSGPRQAASHHRGKALSPVIGKPIEIALKQPSDAIDRHRSRIVVRIVRPIIAYPPYSMNALSNLRSNAKSVFTSELIDHHGRRRLAVWIVEDMSVIGTERRLKRGKHSHDVRTLQVGVGTSQVLTTPRLIGDRTRIRGDLLDETSNRETCRLVFAQHLLNVGSPFRQKVRHFRQSTPTCYGSSLP